MKMSREQYAKIINRRKIQDSKPECQQAKSLGGTIQGKEKSMGRIIVSFTGYRVRPLDPDNFAGSVKDLLDGLRHAGLISGDEPTKIKLVTDQVKVRHYEEEKTVIELEDEIKGKNEKDQADCGLGRCSFCTCGGRDAMAKGA